MIKVKDGKLQAELLDNKGTLSNKIIEQYDYIELKNDFAEIVDILSTNMLVHAMYQEALKYEITEDLEFKIFIDENVKDYTMTYDFATNYTYFSKTNTSLITLDRKNYDRSIEMCMILLKKVKASYDKLNEVEKFIIKSLEFDNPPETDEELPEQVARAVELLSSFDPRGDILAFLPGEREIRDCTEMLTGRGYPNTEVLPLYARLAAGDQQKVFRCGRKRRIVLSTNVAETSLTIPGIKFCIDSGLARVSRYNPRTRIQELQLEMISQASARQRRGRCGRTADGICVKLYSEADLEMAPEYTDPEIKRSSLAGVILQMAALKLPERFREMVTPKIPSASSPKASSHSCTLGQEEPDLPL